MQSLYQSQQVIRIYITKHATRITYILSYRSTLLSRVPPPAAGSSLPLLPPPSTPGIEVPPGLDGVEVDVDQNEDIVEMLHVTNIALGPKCGPERVVVSVALPEGHVHTIGSLKRDHCEQFTVDLVLGGLFKLVHTGKFPISVTGYRTTTVNTDLSDEDEDSDADSGEGGYPYTGRGGGGSEDDDDSEDDEDYRGSGSEEDDDDDDESDDSGDGDAYDEAGEDMLMKLLREKSMAEGMSVDELAQKLYGMDDEPGVSDDDDDDDDDESDQSDDDDEVSSGSDMSDMVSLSDGDEVADIAYDSDEADAELGLDRFSDDEDDEDDSSTSDSDGSGSHSSSDENDSDSAEPASTPPLTSTSLLTKRSASPLPASDAKKKFTPTPTLRPTPSTKPSSSPLASTPGPRGLESEWESDIAAMIAREGPSHMGVVGARVKKPEGVLIKIKTLVGRSQKLAMEGDKIVLK